MSNINIFSKVLGNAADLSKYVLEYFSKIITQKFFSQAGKIEKDVSKIVIDSIRKQPEYTALKSGELRHQFGIANTSAVDQVLSALDDIQVKVLKPKISQNGLDASLIINMIKENFEQDITSYGSYVSEKGSQIDWLRWLLLEGNNSVVIGYKYLPKADPSSRTGKGIMVKGRSSIFRVPPSFAGVSGNNWITRGIDAALPEIQSYIDKVVKSAL